MKINPAKLRSTAKDLGLRMPDAQLLCAQERFLARIATLPEGNSFIWKGGSLVLRVYNSLAVPRFTVDIDLMVEGFDINRTTEVFEAACNLYIDDGFSFGEITIDHMQRDTPYGGHRYKIVWSYDNKPCSQLLKIDVCTGDTVKDETRSLKDTTFFTSEELVIRVYPPEYIFAEKLETAARFGTGNSRLKDFIDLWSLAKLNIDRVKQAAAITDCFDKRGTELSLPELCKTLDNEGLLASLEPQMKKYYIQRLNLPPLKDILTEVKRHVTCVLGKK